MAADETEGAIEPPQKSWRRLESRQHRHPLSLRYPKQALIGLTLACAVATGGYWLHGRWSHVTENDARVKADMITISSRVDGWVTERTVTDGDTIRQDEQLVVIDQRQARSHLEELHAKAEAVRLQQDRLGTELQMVKITAPAAVTSAAAHRAAAEARHRSAAAHLEQARHDFQRADAVVERLVSREVWDQRQTLLRQAEDAERSAAADLTAADAAQADARARLGDIEVLRKDLQRLGQEAAQIDAQIDQQKINFDDRQVRSPINGIVDEKFVQPGEYVIPGQRMFTVHDPKGVWINADIKESKMEDLKVGQPVDISVDAYPNRRFSGRIERIGNAATSEFALLPSPNPSGNFTKVTQRVPVRIAVAQPEDNPLRPGMMVEVDIDTANR
jgi:membrane fusion protein (multidrug efflux system)